MYEYKLKYNNKEEAISDFKDKNIILTDENNNDYIKNGISIVYIGTIVDQPGEYDIDGNEITAPTYVTGYHIDILSDTEYTFTNSVSNISTPYHKFWR